MIFQIINNLELPDFEFIVATRITPEEFENKGNRIKPGNSFDDYSTLADNTDTISQFDGI